MDGFTVSLLASATYSLLMRGWDVSTTALRKLLPQKELNEEDLKRIVDTIRSEQITDDWSEKRIEKCFNTVPEIVDIVSRVKTEQRVNVNVEQQHTGVGNNEANIKF